METAKASIDLCFQTYRSIGIYVAIAKDLFEFCADVCGEVCVRGRIDHRINLDKCRRVVIDGLPLRMRFAAADTLG